MLGRLLCWVGLHAWEGRGIQHLPGGGVLRNEFCRRRGCNRARLREEGF